MGVGKVVWYWALVSDRRYARGYHHHDAQMLGWCYTQILRYRAVEGILDGGRCGTSYYRRNAVGIKYNRGV